MAAAALLIGVAWGEPAWAHKIEVFAAVKGRQIEGQAYVAGGDPVPGRPVRILDPAGELLGETVTDQEGRFTFQPDRVCDHTVVVNAGFGHKAQFTVPTSELPADLSAADRATGAAGSAGQVARGGPAADHELGPRIESLQQQLFALRADIDKWKAHLRIQDVLGGVGYILGLAGVAFYFLGLRQRRGERQP